MQNSIQTVRENLGLTQVEFARLVNIPVKSIRNWEQNIRVPADYIIELVLDYVLRLKHDQEQFQEDFYIPSFLQIKEKVKQVVATHNIEKVYLYGSYAKGTQTPESDIDFYMISDIEDIEYFGVIEELRTAVNKKVDLLSNKTIKKNSPIAKEIERTGILIYERRKIH
ncbi:MAG: nucleotidyltransferase domain-containing protein [Bacilli bacterium]|jgi:predicted nucleotidyltransferase|nr:nucleotidyltransferase domain-containing protein [Bacilli bacterium]NLN80152.1 helix-turn-helix domain-containing protein [Erysipelotrichia bacterium]